MFCVQILLKVCEAYFIASLELAVIISSLLYSVVSQMYNTVIDVSDREFFG
jgi:hypothetical protein